MSKLDEFCSAITLPDHVEMNRGEDSVELRSDKFRELPITHHKPTLVYIYEGEDELQIDIVGDNNADIPEYSPEETAQYIEDILL